MALQPYAFQGGTAVVTGAAGGIGAALAEALGDRRSHLALVDRDAEGLARTAAVVRARQPDLRVTEHVCDLAETEHLCDLVQDVVRSFPTPTLLVNNAGVALAGRFDQVGLDDFDWVMRINFQAAVHLTHALLPALRQTSGSHLVNVSSVFGLVAPPGQAAYAASKFALRGFTEALRHELYGAGVGVTAVYPGGVRTAIAENARLGRGVDPDEGERGRREFGRLLTIDPRAAAWAILDGVARRRARVLVGASAKLPDLLARLAPGSYWAVAGRAARLRRARQT